MTLIIRTAQLADASVFADKLRDADKREIEALAGMSPEEGITFSLNESQETYAAFDSSGDPVAIGGVGLNYLGGTPWLMATPLVLNYRKSLVSVSCKYLMKWLAHYNFLSNAADARNTLHINWLRRMGFHLTPAKTGIGHDPDVPFHFFYRSTKCA